MKHLIHSINRRTLLLFAALSLLLSTALPALASATTLNQAGVRLGRLSVNAGSGGSSDGNDLLVTFKLRTTPTSVSKVSVAFPTGFTVTTGTPATGTTFPNTPASIAAPAGLPGTATATSGTKSILVSGLTSGSLNSTTLYGFTIPAGTITNPGSTGSYDVTVCSGGASLAADCSSNVIDSSTVPVSIVASGADQVGVSATVAPNFTFSLSANSDTISPSLDPNNIRTSSGVTMNVSTNSPLGYTAYVKSKNGGLTSAASPGTPITTGTFNGSPDTLSAGTTNYGLVPSTSTTGTGSGSISYDTEYASVGGTQAGAFNSTNFASFVSRSGYTDQDQFSLKERAAVSANVQAATDYSDTLTIVAAGNF